MKKVIFAYIAVILGILFIDFIISAGLIKIICWAFGLAFSWKLAIGVWIALSILHGVFRSSSGGNK